MGLRDPLSWNKTNKWASPIGIDSPYRCAGQSSAITKKNKINRGEREKDRPVNPEDLDRHSPIEASTAGFLFFQKLPPLYNEQIKFEYNIFSVQKT